MSHSIPKAVSFQDKLQRVKRHWTPHRIARFDGHQVLLARLSGEFVWHDHEGHDEVFMPLSGELCLDIEDAESGTVQEVRVVPGEMLVVPAGTRHRPRTVGEDEVTLLLIDPMAVKHTGNVRDEKTVDEYPDIESPSV